LPKLDFQLALALLAPWLVWPWLPGWDSIHLQEGQFSAIALIAFIPIIEEVLFRGFLQGWLLQKNRFKQNIFGVSRANWLTSFSFAVAHLWQHVYLLVPGYLVVSLLLGHFRERYHGILVPVLLHGYYNLGLIYYASSAQ
jgi:uncharacterized protein